jgi:hypothetical protein
LLWWKRRIINREIEEQEYSSPAKQFLYMFCFKIPSSASLNPQNLCSLTDTQVHEPEAQYHSNKDTWLKQFGGREDELLNLSVPPRFLFTINEETKEDLESDEAKSRGRSLSDILLTIETPFLTPLDSPSHFSYSPNSGFNPLFETTSDAEFNRIKSSPPPPPPKFKFLKDADDKLLKTEMIDEEDESDFEEESESFITLIVDSSRDIEVNSNPNFPKNSSSTSNSQVLPLAASPPTFRASSCLKNPT